MTPPTGLHSPPTSLLILLPSHTVPSFALLNDTYLPTPLAAGAHSENDVELWQKTDPGAQGNLGSGRVEGPMPMLAVAVALDGIVALEEKGYLGATRGEGGRLVVG